MNINTTVRVAGHAALCIVDFLTGIDEDDEELAYPYVDQLLNSALELLKTNNPIVQEHAFACIASVSTVCHEKFATYYDSLMPIFNQIFIANDDDENIIKTKARAIECLGKVVMAVGKNKFISDAEAMVSYLLKERNKVMNLNDDLRSVAINQCLCCIGRTLGEDFASALSSIIPELIHKVSQADKTCFITDKGEKLVMNIKLVILVKQLI